MTADLRVLYHLLRGQPRRGSHAERLQAFYAPQAERYDDFRERLLHGRAELIASLDVPDGARIAELGGGTGRNLLHFGERLQRMARVDIVDLCPALLDRARDRFAGSPNVHVVEADATRWRPDRPLDLVLFSYALTMIPDWREAIDNAVSQLTPGGALAVVDFYVSAGNPGPGRQRHSDLARWFWPRWFRHDGVELDHRRLDHLCHALPEHDLVEASAGVPYLPGLRVPYYRFVGRRG
jgi:S-adenosylmethionine-diacylgycerolhomoserine-N-methlytransferase